jgi:hypothetical protein
MHKSEWSESDASTKSAPSNTNSRFERLYPCFSESIEALRRMVWSLSQDQGGFQDAK